MLSNCPLCANSSTYFYHQDNQRTYLQCPYCSLVFVHPDHLPTKATEHHEYSLHQNDTHDPGYRRFLNKAAEPLLARIIKDSHGLDFGCGPAPVLAEMLADHGHTMAIYDPLYYPDDWVLKDSYDFITCTEAIEHFHTPGTELELLDNLLRPGGWLCIMTKRVINHQRFISWHYKNDQTHVSFFSDHTFNVIGQMFNYTVHLVAPDVVLMCKQSYNTQS